MYLLFQHRFLQLRQRGQVLLFCRKMSQFVGELIRNNRRLIDQYQVFSPVRVMLELALFERFGQSIVAVFHFLSGSIVPRLAKKECSFACCTTQKKLPPRPCLHSCHFLLCRCKLDPFVILTDECRFVDTQKLRLQELPEHVSQREFCSVKLEHLQVHAKTWLTNRVSEQELRRSSMGTNKYFLQSSSCVFAFRVKG